MKALVLALGAVLAAAGASASLPADVTTADVCAAVPGAEVANALGATLVGAKLVRPEGRNARCVYTVQRPGAQGERSAFVLWLHAAGDYDDLRGAQDDPPSPVDGLGDAAFIAFHRDEGRHDLFVLLRGVAAVEVTGPDAASVRTVAGVAIGRIRPTR